MQLLGKNGYVKCCGSKITQNKTKPTKKTQVLSSWTGFTIDKIAKENNELGKNSRASKTVLNPDSDV